MLHRHGHMGFQTFSMLCKCKFGISSQHQDMCFQWRLWWTSYIYMCGVGFTLCNVGCNFLFNHWTKGAFPFLHYAMVVIKKRSNLIHMLNEKTQMLWWCSCLCHELKDLTKLLVNLSQCIFVNFDIHQCSAELSSIHLAKWGLNVVNMSMATR